MKQSIGIHIPAPMKQHYDVFIGKDLIEELPELLPAQVNNHSLVIMTDNTVKKLYGQQLLDVLKKYGKKVDILSFPAGENNKTADTKSRLDSAMLKKQFGRDTCIIALGGGIVGDMAGFVAATYMRGIPYVQVPTTLLAMVDSSIGGKTAINTPEGKNVIGAFWNPVCVIADLNFLDTLPNNHHITGWIEALKIFMTCDAVTFKEASQENKPTALFIKKAIEWKADVVARDPKENSVRAILNFGHTIGHALEKASDHKLLHGYAVAYGILVETQIAFQRKLITKSDLNKITETINRLGIKGQQLKKHDLSTVLKFTRSDKKAKDNQVRYVLLQGLGHVYVSAGHYTHIVTDAEVKSAWAAALTGDIHGGK